MKTFNTPYVDVIKFKVADVITASTDEEEEEEQGPIEGPGSTCVPLG